MFLSGFQRKQIWQHLKSWFTKPLTSTPTCYSLLNLYIPDAEEPMLTCPPNQSAPIYDNTTTRNMSWPLPNVWDNSGIVGDVSCSAGNSTQFPLGWTNVTCNVTDDNGNRDSCVFEVFVYSEYQTYALLSLAQMEKLLLKVIHRQNVNSTCRKLPRNFE